MQTLKDRPFALLGVNIAGNTPATLKRVLDRERLTWRNFVDRGEIGQGPIATRWNLTATPTFYLIDHEGIIRHKWPGGAGDRVIAAALERWIRAAEGK